MNPQELDVPSFRAVKSGANDFKAFQNKFLSKESEPSFEEINENFSEKRIIIDNFDQKISLENPENPPMSPSHTFHPPKSSKYTLSIPESASFIKENVSSPFTVSLCSSPPNKPSNFSSFSKKSRRMRPRNSRTLEIGPKGTIIEGGSTPKAITFTEVMEFKTKEGKFENNNLLEEHLRKRNSTVIPFVKKFMAKLKNASPFRNIAQLRMTNFQLLNDKSYFYDEVIKEQNLVESKGLKKAYLKLKGVYESQTYRLRNLLCWKWLKSVSNKHRTVLHPYQNIKIIWDICHMILIVFWFFYIPLLMAFEEVHKAEYDQNYPLSFFTSIFLACDILINFNTSYFKNGIEEKRRHKIFKYYISSRFPYDFLTCLPVLLDWIIYSNLSAFGIANYQSYRYFHYIKYFFFVKFTTFREITNRILEKFQLKEKFQNILALFKVFFVSVLVAHLFACFWYLVADLSSSSESWLSKMSLLDSDWKTQYLYSVYWASVTMMTVGYGDITPQNKNETIFCLIAVLLGCAVYAFNINSIGMILQDINKESISFNHKINIINQFMQRKKIHNDLQMRVREYLRFIWKEENAQNLEEEHKIIELLSNSLKEELLIEAYGSVLQKYPMFFANFSENSLRKVVTIIKDIKFIPDESIFAETEEDDHSIFFIMKGKVELIANNSGENPLIVRDLGVGDYFGEIAFFSGKKRFLSAKSKDFTTLFSIDRSEFIRVLQANSDDFEKFCMIQDQILLYENYFPLKMRCFSCNQLGHLAGQCPLIHFLADKEKVIKTYNFYVDQERDTKFLRRNRKKNALFLKRSLQETSKKVKIQIKKERAALNELNMGSSQFTSSELFSEEDDEYDDEDDEDEEEEEFNENFESHISEKTNENEEEDTILGHDQVSSYKQLDNLQKDREIDERKYSASQEDLKNLENIENSAHVLSIPATLGLHKRHSASAAIISSKFREDLKETEIRSAKKSGGGTDIYCKKKRPTLDSSTVTSHSKNKSSKTNAMEGIFSASKAQLSAESLKKPKIRHSNPNVVEELPGFPMKNSHKSILKVSIPEKLPASASLSQKMIPAGKSLSSLPKNHQISPSIRNNSVFSNTNTQNNGVSSLTNVNSLNSMVLAPSNPNELNKLMDNFERVQNFKNYFPHNNCKTITESLNQKKILPYRYSKSLKDRRKSMEARLAKYTFFLDEMKEKMPSAIKKKAQMQKKKRIGFMGKLPTFKEEEGGYKFDDDLMKKKQKQWQTKQYFSNLVGKEQNKLNFSDVVNLIIHDPFLKKQIKKKK